MSSPNPRQQIVLSSVLTLLIVSGAHAQSVRSSRPPLSPEEAVAIFVRTHPPLTWPDPLPAGPNITIIGSRDDLYPLLTRPALPQVVVTQPSTIYGLDPMTAFFLTAGWQGNGHGHPEPGWMPPAPAPAPSPALTQPEPRHIVMGAVTAGKVVAR